MADSTIATYYVQLEPTTKGITKGIENEFSGIGKSGGAALSVALGSTLSSAASGIAGIAMSAISGSVSAVSEFGKASVESGAQFDTSMSQVAATMGKTVQELENEVGHAETSFGSFDGTLREFAQFMGANTAFSASQAADALNYMALAGYSAQESMDMLPNVLNLAAAGNMDLARASDMVTDAQTALGLTFPEVNTMVDQMAKTASTTNTSVEQLGDAILTIGGTAQFMAGGTEELNAVLGVLADNGIKGSEAGTHLRNMILKLSDPTKEGAIAMEKLGLEVFDAEGKMRDFESIFQDLNVAMADFTEEEKIQTFSSLFNTRDVASATALLNTTTERWGEVKIAIDDAKDSASEMAATQLDNLAGDVTIFQSALEGLQIVFSDQLAPTLRDFVQFGTGGLQALTDGFNEDGLAGAITNGIDYLVQNLPDLIDKVVDGLFDVMDAVWQKLPGVLENGIPKIQELLQKLATKALEFLQSYMEVFPTMLQESVDFYTEFFPFLVELATQLITGFAESFADIYPIVLPATLEMMTAIINAILNNLPELVNAAIIIFTGFMNGMVSMIPTLVSATIKIIGQLVETIVELVPTLLLAGVRMISEFVVTLVTTMLNFLKADYWKDMLDSIVKSFTDVDWKGIGDQLIKGIIDGIVGGYNKLKEAVTTTAEGIQNTFTGIFKIESPSKVFKWYGEMMNEGLALGIEDDDASVSAMKKMSDNVEDSFNPQMAASGAGNIVIPVYLGNELLQTIVVDAMNTANYRSGGR